MTVNSTLFLSDNLVIKYKIVTREFFLGSFSGRKRHERFLFSMNKEVAVS